MTCQTERTLTGQLGDTGKLPISSKLETQAAPTMEMADNKTATPKVEPTPKATKQEPSPVPKKLAQVDPLLKETEPAKLKSTTTEPSTKIEPKLPLGSPKTEVLPDQAERNSLLVSKAEPSTMEITQKDGKASSEAQQQQDLPTAKIETDKSEGEENIKKEITKVQDATYDHVESEVQIDAAITSTSKEKEDSKVPICPVDSEEGGYEVPAQAETNKESLIPENILKEVKSDEPLKTTEHAQISLQADLHAKLEEEKLEEEMQPVAAADSKEVEEEMTKKTLKSQVTPSESILEKVRIVFFIVLVYYFEISRC